MTAGREKFIAAVWYFAAAIGTLAVFGVAPAVAVDLATYKAQIENARTRAEQLTGIVTAVEAGDEDAPIARLRLLEDLRAALPATETVEWRGQTVETSNAWFAEQISRIENEASPTRQAVELTKLSESLAGIAADLDAAVSSGTETRTKDDDKRKLAEILSRDEYQKPSADKKYGTSLIQRFIDWLSSWFPEPNLAEPDPGAFASFARLLQIAVFVVIGALIIFLIYKFGAAFFPSARRGGGKSGASKRTILGESIAADTSSEDLFGEAERLALAGEVRAAIRKGYIALLCELSDRRIIHLEQHKTNRDYLRDVRSRGTLHERLGSLTGSFERHWYGEQPARAPDWEFFRDSYRKALTDV